jgi:hypothetical protein
MVFRLPSSVFGLPSTVFRLQTAICKFYNQIASSLSSILEKEPPPGVVPSLGKPAQMRGIRKFRSHRENGEWGAPELRRINLKLSLWHIATITICSA